MIKIIFWVVINLKKNYNATVFSCFVGFVSQAIVVGYVPLLFLTFSKTYNIPLEKITLLITVNFVVQLTVDFLSAKFVDKIGYRTSIIAAHLFAALGLIGLTILPEILPSKLSGLLISVVIYAIGSGLLEVLASPIAMSCPVKNKEKAMSMLHSFYCWGYVGVVLLSTAFFHFFGTGNWKVITLLWTIIPLLNSISFSIVPIPEQESGHGRLSLKELFSTTVFWIFAIMMMASGASELAVGQWSSAFAEQGLKVSKTVGDLAGPMAFSFFQGLSRWFYGKFGDKIDLDKFMTFSGILCVISYLIIALVKIPVIGMIGCSICGLSVGIMWPGTYSKASDAMKSASTALFAMLALSGDLGCTLGPTVAGFVSGAFNDNLHIGILAAVIFPVILLIGLFLINRLKKKQII